MEQTVNKALVTAVGAIVAAGVAISGCSSSTKNGASGGDSGSKPAAKASSAADFGGMDALVAAAKKEGKLNVITLPRDWANYGELMDNFKAKYGIQITDDNPDGSSADEINAIKSLKGQDRAPDVVDVGMAFAYSGTAQKLFAPYKVATWSSIPDNAKDAAGNWFNDYGGMMSIGCDASKVSPCPASFKELNNPAYKGKVALNGDPTKANAAINAVTAVALANGGSLDNVQPGIDFFKTLKSAGVYKPVQATAATITSGATPIVLDWDYLNAAKTAKVDAAGLKWTVTVPADSTPLAGYYAQAISASAPHPAAARLWEEYLYSVEGQNGFLKGGARPVEADAMHKAGSIDSTLYARLPKVSGSPIIPTKEQSASIASTLVTKWASTVGQ